MPTIICTDCCDKLENFYKFFKQAAEVQTYLDSIYQPTENEINIEDQRVIVIKYNPVDFYLDQQEAEVVINLNLDEGVELENLTPEELNKIIQEQLNNLNQGQINNNFNQDLVADNVDVNPEQLVDTVIEEQNTNTSIVEQVISNSNEEDIINNLNSEEIIINTNSEEEEINNLRKEYEKIVNEVSSEFNDLVDDSAQKNEVNSGNTREIEEEKELEELNPGDEDEKEDNEEDEVVKLEREEIIKKLKKTKVVTSRLTITEAIQGYPWRCTICNYGVMKSYKELQYHYKHKHNEPPVYKCMHCEREYSLYRSFTKHFLLHEDPKRFE